jgi:ribosomal protein S18 acetylase RimI-like enzyme
VHDRAVTATLPPGWSLRPPTLDDVPEILAVVHASDIAAVGEADFTTEEVVEILTAPHHNPEQDSWVALDANNKIVGWAYIDNALKAERENFDAYVHPTDGREAHPALLDHVVARVAQRAAERGLASLVARGGAIASEEAYIGLLRSRGFAFVKRYARMRRTLTGPLPDPEVPAGVVVRPVRHSDEAEMRAFHDVLDVAFRDTPDYLPSTYEAYQERLAAMPSIEWDEWFVAEVDGAVAGILQSSGQVAEQDEGWVKNLAVRKEHRGRGLGRMLLLTAFRVYAAKGRTAVGLGVDTTNPTGAYRLYESVGMHPVYEADIYEQTIRAA